MGDSHNESNPLNGKADSDGCVSPKHAADDQCSVPAEAEISAVDTDQQVNVDKQSQDKSPDQKMAQEEPETAEVRMNSDSADAGEVLLNGMGESANLQKEEADDKSAADGPAEDADVAGGEAAEEHDACDDAVDGKSATTQGFEAAEDPTGATSSDQSNGDSASHVKGILGAAPAVSSSGVNGEAGGAAEAPKVPTQHTFYLVRVPRPDLSDVFSEIAEAEIKLEDKRKKYQFISTAMKLKQSARREVAENRREHRNRSNAISDEVQRKYEEIKPMQDKVKEIREAGSETRNAGRSLQVTSIEQLQRRLAEIEYRMQHESITLQEEKQLLREMQTLEKSRPEVEAHEARRSTVSDQQGHREGLQNQLKPLLAEVEALKQQRDAERKIADTFNAEVEALDREIDSLAKERQAAHEAQEAAYTRLKALRQESYHKEVEFRQYRKDLTTALQFVAAKDVAALQTFCAEQVEKLHTKWQSTPFRANYIKANERSTLRRFQSLDTRRPGLDEDPAELINAAGRGAESGGGPGKGKPGAQANGDAGAKREPKAVKEVKKPAEAVVPEAQEAVEVEVKKAPPTKEGAPPPAKKVESEGPLVDAEAAAAAKKAEAEELAALKEKRREEAIAKAKEAEERKKKLAEKAQARAAARAAKEAEETAKRKEKERQRRERKKAAAAANAAETDPTDTPAEETPDEAETEEASVNAVPASKEEDGLTSRQRKRNAAQRKKATGDSGKVSLPQSVAKKSSGSSSSFWIYSTGIAVAVLIVLVAILAATTPWGAQA